MADFSEHLDRTGEFFVGLFGLLLLLSFHPPFRRWARAKSVEAARFALRACKAANARSPSLHRWTVAFRMIFKERRGLLLVIGALIAFDYAAYFHDALMHKYVITPYYESGRGADYTFSYIYNYTTLFLYHLASTMFGWLAMQRARNIEFVEAVRFRPYGLFVAFFFCISGAGTIVPIFAPGWVASIEYWSEDPLSRLYLFSSLAIGLAIYAIGGYFFVRKLTNTPNAIIVPALIGYIALTQALYWFERHMRIYADESSLLISATGIVAEFTDLLLWNIAFVAFVVVLAAPEEARQRTDNKKSPNAA